MKRKWSELSGGERDALLRDYRRMPGPIACAKHNADYNSVRNSLSRSHRKAQHGGKRPGSGNKKGVQFCSVCRAKLTRGECSRDKKHSQTKTT